MGSWSMLIMTSNLSDFVFVICCHNSYLVDTNKLEFFFESMFVECSLRAVLEVTIYSCSFGRDSSTAEVEWPWSMNISRVLSPVISWCTYRLQALLPHCEVIFFSLAVPSGFVAFYLQLFTHTALNSWSDETSCLFSENVTYWFDNRLFTLHYPMQKFEPVTNRNKKPPLLLCRRVEHF